MDQFSLDRLKDLYPDVREKAVKLHDLILEETGRKIRITEGLRSMKRQLELYSKGRELNKDEWRVVNKKQIVTNAKPGESIHHYGLAFDICFVGTDPYLEKLQRKYFEETWRKCGDIGIWLGLQWGYDWNGNGKVDKNDFDRPHFQCLYGLKLPRLKLLYAVDGLSTIYSTLDATRGVETDWDPDALPKQEKIQ